MSALTGVYASHLEDNGTDEAIQPNPDNFTQTDSLKDLIIHAKDNDTVYLENKTYDGEDNTRITIDKSINFVGSEGTVIDGENKNSIFLINDNVKVSFKNIKFTNAYKSGTGEDVYGAVLQINNAEVIIENCQFISNHITYGKSQKVYGAAISSYGNLSIINSYFLDNNINSAYGHEGFGGVIYNNGFLFVDNASFIKSRGGEYSRGSVIYNNKVALINNSILADTYSLEESIGSTIFNNGNLTLSNCIIENNTIGRTNVNYIYGNIFNIGLLIAHGNIFKNNTGYYKQPNSGYTGSPTIYNLGDLYLSYNAFIDNIGGFKNIYRDVYLNGGKLANIDNNWWGSNDNPFSTQAINTDKASSWLTLDVKPSYSTLKINESIDITASWKLSNGSNPKYLIPLDVIFTDEFDKSQKNSLTTQTIFTFNNTQNKGSYVVNITLYSFKQSVIVDVGKIYSNIIFENNNNIYSNEKLNIKVSLYDENSNLIDGKIILSIGNQKKEVNLVNGQASVSFTNLLPDNYELKMEYDGDDNYFKSTLKTNITIKKYPIILSVEEIGIVHVDEQFDINVVLDTKEMEGAANLYIDGLFKNIVYLKTGGTIINFSNFDEGDYNITIEVPGDEYYQAIKVSSIVKVRKHASNLNIVSSDIFINENETLTITTCDDFMGSVILSINGVNNTLFLKNSTTKIILSNLTAGDYDVDLIFKGNGKFSSQNTSTSFKVVKYSSSLVVNITNNQINVKTLPNNCTGSVTVYINRKTYILNLTGGEATFNVEYDAGTNYIHVFYSGNEFYNSSTFNTTIGEGDAVAIIGVNVTAFEYNDFNYTVSIFEQNGYAIPDKVIKIKVNYKTYDILTNSKGIAILPLNLKEGDYEVISTYGKLTTTNYIIIKPIQFNLTSNNISCGENAIITAEFDKNIKGKVNFTLSNGLTQIINITDGNAIFTINNLTFGKWEVTAFYTNTKFNSSSLKTTFEVEKLNPTIILNIKEAFEGQNETIIAKTNDLTGNITFIIDDKEFSVAIVEGEAKLTASDLDGGRHILKIIYAGDASHKNTILTQEFYIKNKNTKIILSINETAYGEEIKILAKVDDDAVGNITFSVNNLYGSSQIKNGLATWSFRGLDVGSYTIKADYSGDNQFMSNSSQSNFKVIKASSEIEVYVNEVVLDENIRIYAKLSPNATGKVSFRMVDYYSPRDKDIVNSTAKWLIAPLQTGQYTVIATYSGDRNYYSSSTTYILNVFQTRSILFVEVDDAASNDRIIIKTTLTSSNGVNITGIVDVQVDGKEYEINVREGIGTLVLGKIKPGEYKLNAIYKGDENFSSSKASCDFTVSDSLLESILICDNVTKYYNNDVKFQITLTNAKNKPIQHQTIHVIIKGVENTYETDENGKVYLTIGNKMEKYDVNVEYRGSNSYYPSNATATVEVLSTIESQDVLKEYGSETQYFAIFRDFNGKALSNTNVTFKIAGNFYNYTTRPNGIIRLNINLNPGKYEIVAINPVTGENVTNTLTITGDFVENKDIVNSLIIENKDVVNYFGAKSTYKVRVYGSDGKPLGKVVSVTFKVNGKTYFVKTDTNGYAILSIKLKVKQYIISAEFNGTKVFNKITVKPVLTTKIASNKKNKKTKLIAKLVNTKGKPVKGKKITFKIKNKTYKAKTNKKGIASVSIKLKLKKGNYKLRVISGKSKIVNKFKVT